MAPDETTRRTDEETLPGDTTPRPTPEGDEPQPKPLGPEPTPPTPPGGPHTGEEPANLDYDPVKKELEERREREGRIR